MTESQATPESTAPITSKGRTRFWAFTGAFLALGAIGVGVLIAWEQRRGPFSTGTGIRAFMGTTFEMSVPEVERVMGHRLLSCSDPESKTQSSLRLELDCEGEWVDKELASHEWTGFVPRLYLFESQAPAIFGFFDRRLTNIEVEFAPSGHGDGERLAATLAESLTRAYGQCARENSKEFPGAYSLECTKNPVSARLWVNLTDKAQPFVTLGVYYPVLRDAYKSARRVREASPF